MPSIFTHAVVPLAAALVLERRRLPWWMVGAGMLAAMAPDVDGVLHNLGVAASGMWGHRGYTHSLGFALLVGVVGLVLAKRWGVSRGWGFAWMALCAFSHPALDCFTDGGAGVPLWWPLVDTRYHAPWRPVVAAPMSIPRFFFAARPRRDQERIAHRVAAVDRRRPAYFADAKFS